MDENSRLSSSAPSLRPRIALPASSTVESLLTVGGGWPGASPGPMTLVSNFFTENDVESDCRSFSQLLAGAMLSPAEVPGRSRTNNLDVGDSSSNKEANNGHSGGGGGDVDFQFSNTGQPSSLVVTQPSMFTIPPGLSPASLLDSPGFFPPAQQALAQVTGQAAQAQAKTTRHHRVPPPVPDHNTTKEPSELSNSGSHSQPPSVAADKPAEDGYNWRKYGQKHVKGSEYPRGYYKCTHPNCPVKKQVERSLDGLVTEIIYKGQHNHEPPRSKLGKYATVGISGFGVQTGNFNHSREETSVHTSTMKDQESAHEQLGSSDSEEVSDDVTKRQPKRRNVEVRAFDPVSSHRTRTEPRIIVQATSKVDLLDDGYRWRKYGQKVVKGNPHPRSYYKCTSKGCNVRKHVERAASDPKAVITTYEGKHNHHVPAAKKSSHNIANNTTSQPRPHDGIGLFRFKDEE